MAVLSPYALCSLALAKEHLGIKPSNTDYDDIVTRTINAATDRFEKYTGRMLMRRTGLVEYQDGVAQNRLLLGQWPASKPTELWIDTGRKFDNVINKLSTDEYSLDYSVGGEGIGVLLHSRLFPVGAGVIKLVYDAGYVSAPAALEDACLWAVEFLYDMRGDKRIGVSQKGKNQENTTFYSDFPPTITNVLDAYKRADFFLGASSVVTR